MSVAKIEAAACQCCCKQQIKTDKSKMLALCSHTLIFCVQVTIRRRPFGTCAVPANKYSHLMLRILAKIHGSDVEGKKKSQSDKKTKQILQLSQYSVHAFWKKKKKKKTIGKMLTVQKIECLKGQNQFWNLIEASCKFEQAA